MQPRFLKRRIASVWYRDAGAIFEDLEFDRCDFENSGLGATRDPALRSTVRRVVLRSCSTRRVWVGPVIAEDVLIDGLRTRDLLQTWAPALRHVILRGRVGRIMVSPYVEPSSATARQQADFAQANERYYRTVDWALDITEAEPEELELYGVPARLVRRDPEVSAIVTREAALRGDWRRLPLDDTWWPQALRRLAANPVQDVVLVAPRRHRDFATLVAGLRQLKDAGIATAD